MKALEQPDHVPGRWMRIAGIADTIAVAVRGRLASDLWTEIADIAAPIVVLIRLVGVGLVRAVVVVVGDGVLIAVGRRLDSAIDIAVDTGVGTAVGSGATAERADIGDAHLACGALAAGRARHTWADRRPVTGREHQQRSDQRVAHTTSIRGGPPQWRAL